MIKLFFYCACSRLWRPPLRIDPESIVQGSALEALQVTAFLAENYPHFFADDATEEVAAAAAYLSDAGGWAPYLDARCGNKQQHDGYLCKGYITLDWSICTTHVLLQLGVNQHSRTTLGMLGSVFEQHVSEVLEGVFQA